MPLKADKTAYIHGIRDREFGAIFGRCAAGTFARALELGAGDGYVSTLLAPLCGRLVCTDINDHRLRRRDVPNAEYRVCDAEQVGEAFDGEQFDLIFSSNLLEHLPDPDRALDGMQRLLCDDGVAVHVLPNRWWKLVTVALHAPNKIAKTLDRWLFARSTRRDKTPRPYTGNNPKKRARRQFFLAKPFVPRVHGASRTTVGEFVAFGVRRWRRRFERAGLEVLAIRPACFSSGYGFDRPGLRRAMERLGIHTCTAFVLAHRGRRPPAAEMLLRQGRRYRSASAAAIKSSNVRR
ncbi:MAG: class I SAM-dependent methyltransferase [Phycisphaerae bacterium]|nr:class I SAM-dependent methyltransferase [Phycisphaerae bacterium]